MEHLRIYVYMYVHDILYIYTYWNIYPLFLGLKNNNLVILRNPKKT